jgi:hypothetical protein
MDTEAIQAEIKYSTKNLLFGDNSLYSAHQVYGSVAQLVEQKTLNLLVAGSNPARSTRKNLIALKGTCITVSAL